METDDQSDANRADHSDGFAAAVMDDLFGLTALNDFDPEVGAAMTQLVGRHMPGAGPAEPAWQAIRFDDGGPLQELQVLLGPPPRGPGPEIPSHAAQTQTEDPRQGTAPGQSTRIRQGHPVAQRERKPRSSSSALVGR